MLAEFQHGTNIYDAVINRIYNGNVDTVIILPCDRPDFILSLAGHCDRPIEKFTGAGQQWADSVSWKEWFLFRAPE